MFGGCTTYDPVKPAEALAKLAGTTVFTFSEFPSLSVWLN